MASRRLDIDFTGLLMPIVTSTRSTPPQDRHDDAIVRFKPGGYPDDMFFGLTDDERHTFECNICFLVAKDPRQCVNAHLFCATCIFTWTLSSSGDNRDKCPVCRSPGRYRPDLKAESRLNRKHVVCTEDRCKWKGTLSAFKKHQKVAHSASNESLLPPVILPAMSRGYSRLESSTDSEEMRWRIVRDAGLFPESRGPSVDQQTARGRRRLSHLFEAFSTELEHRRRSIDEHYRVREAHRLDQLNEVESLGRRLDDVSADLDRLMSDMTRDSDRYHGYIRTSMDMEDSLLALSQSFPDNGRSTAAVILAASRRRTPDVEPCLTPEGGPRRGLSPRVNGRRRYVRYRGVDPDDGSIDQSPTPPLIDRASRANSEHILPVYRLLSAQRMGGQRAITDSHSLIGNNNSRSRATQRPIAEYPRHDTELVPLSTSNRQTRLMLPLRASGRLNVETLRSGSDPACIHRDVEEVQDLRNRSHDLRNGAESESQS
ncbi:hypothetical protein LSH36_23g05075 [Paralvinella palmiformis]|uniref:RING-type domain-containing protein n=1 Tax=Paralvinella palmiformis TaxID=53620 RepID=A0AAD9KB58_9ANNE|nr:hypothetical protein LSH36_23g05075 [Paralvinella palmiformis]